MESLMCLLGIDLQPDPGSPVHPAGQNPFPGLAERIRSTIYIETRVSCRRFASFRVPACRARYARKFKK